MSQIVLGKSGGKNVTLDLDALLRGRLLVQANSGKGKSWLLRRLAEQMFGKIQVIIIDPEGEFATLREKFGYVLVGKGGETPADPRSAALVAHKLLELRASAVCDLYEMKPSARHEWVQRFLDAMIDAPKNLWHPCIVMVDEAHVYCPEKGAGESVASEALISMGTRGRKRGFCIIPATQRLGKLRKDLAAELLNVLIGGTFIDIDRKRAADALGVYGTAQRVFFDEIKLLERGHFYALGPAISNERILVEIGKVETSHPEAGSSKHAAEPPPAPEKIRSMLPKLADLPKAAEEKAKTEAELRTEIRSLKAQIRSDKSKENPTQSGAGTILSQRAIRREVRRTLAHYNQDITRDVGQRNSAIRKLQLALSRIHAATEDALKLGTIADRPLPPLPNQDSGGEIRKRDESDTSPARFGPSPAAAEKRSSWNASAGVENNGDLTRPQKAILRAVAEFEAIGRSQISKSWIAARSGVSYRSSAFGNNLGYLRSNGYIEYPGSQQVALTDKGRDSAGMIEPPGDSGEMLQSCLKLLSRSQQAILKILYGRHPEAVDKADLAEAAGISASSSAYGNNLGALRSGGMIEYPAPGKAKCADWLFLE